MKVKETTYDVGVIVGRFQVHELHPGHIDLIDSVRKRHSKVIIFLGLTPLMVTAENPLDFESRKQMILEKFPDIIVLYVKDQHDDTLWSRLLDNQIEDVTTPAQSIVLYGSRDSFIKHYRGKHATLELTSEQETFFSGSLVRKQIASKSAKASADFRAGVVWAAHSRFPVSYTTVDIVIFNDDYTKVLLGRKPAEKAYRLIGGFSEPTNETLEQDARREVMEEAGISITDPIYVCSKRVDDWRYRGEKDQIKTVVFAAKHLSGKPTPGDDIGEVRWFEIRHMHLAECSLNIGIEINATHAPLLAQTILKFTDKKG